MIPVRQSTDNLRFLQEDQKKLLNELLQRLQSLAERYRRFRWAGKPFSDDSLRAFLEESEYQARQDSSLMAEQLETLGFQSCHPFQELEALNANDPITNIRDIEEALINQLVDVMSLAQKHGLYGLELQAKVILLAAESRHYELHQLAERRAHLKVTESSVRHQSLLS